MYQKAPRDKQQRHADAGTGNRPNDGASTVSLQRGKK
jgi:hypothetical protein